MSLLPKTERGWIDLINERDSEIERLKAESDMWKKSFGDLDRKTQKDFYPEIDRLKEENAHFAWRDKDKNKLITELADALRTTCDLLKGYGHYVQHGLDLDKRAREATKDE